eukprot:CAMPEP_0178755516 /NCGR_PEP_ID=MMETSP0744-20121128/12767_1 /TAXON_ID=913974 /ORGANISM="Nitzschia punctata, Strain CCMP561" /LENGTH=164 /DNA_ID=CAMNT_0020409565 /DNA_START=28 /DNA_END=522 /DNA_ORIENTATION=+
MGETTVMEETYYVEETGVEESDVNSTRRSHTCCWKLMDTRKAVLVVDTFHIFAIIFSVLINAIVYHERTFGGFFAGLLGIIISLIGFFSAVRFSLTGSCLATIGFILCFIMDTIGFNWVAILIDILLIYPHGYFAWEVHTGVMTKANYKKEEYLMPGIPALPDI